MIHQGLGHANCLVSKVKVGKEDLVFIANAIKEFSINGKEIKKLNMEMIGSTHRHYKINYKL
jgi:hypothetical protein